MEEFEVLKEESAKKKRVSFGDIFWFQIIFAFGAASIYFIIKIVYFTNISCKNHQLSFTISYIFIKKLARETISCLLCSIIGTIGPIFLSVKYV